MAVGHLEVKSIGSPCFAAPLRAVDEVAVERRGDQMILHAEKRIDAADPYLHGHFPHLSIFPGVFQIEALRQAVIWALGESSGSLPEIRTLRSVRFLAPLQPDDRLTLEATLETPSEGEPFEVDARFRRGDGVTAARVKAEFCFGAEHGA